MSNKEITPYGVLYNFAPEFDNPENLDEPAAIRLLDPSFKNVVIRLGKVTFNETDNNEELVMGFTYDILDGKVKKNKLRDFEITIGNMLHDMILEKISNEV